MPETVRMPSQLEKYMVRLIKDRPKGQRWGQWAMNLFHDVSDDVQKLTTRLPDVYEIDDLGDPKMLQFFTELGEVLR